MPRLKPRIVRARCQDSTNSTVRPRWERTAGGGQISPPKARADVLAVQITAADEQTTWTLTNGGKDEAEFCITLANGVTATPKDGAAERSRVFSRVRVEGATDLQKPGPDGQPLVTTIPAHGTAVSDLASELSKFFPVVRWLDEQL